MPTAIAEIVALLAGGQTPGTDYAGTWIAEFGANVYVRLELTASNGAVAGRLGLGDVHLDASGDVAGAQPVTREPAPIFAVNLRDGVLAFARRNDDDIEHFELRVTSGDAALLTFKPSPADLQELADNHIAMPKPFRLKKVVR